MPHVLSLNGLALACVEEGSYGDLDLNRLRFLLRWGDKVVAVAFLISSSKQSLHNFPHGRSIDRQSASASQSQP